MGKEREEREDWEHCFIVGALYPILSAILINILLISLMAVRGGII